MLVVIGILIFAKVDPTLGVLVAGIVGPLGAYFLASRKMSGKIATSEAAQLWEESRAIREWSATRITACDNECKLLRSELREAKERIVLLEAQLRDANEHIADLERGDHGINTGPA